MMNPKIQSLLIALLGLLIPACSPLGSLRPLGDKPVVLDPEQINGDWIANGGHLKLLILDATNGIAKAAWIEEEGGDLKMKQVELLVRQTGETIFVNVRFTEETNEVYVVGRGKLDDNTLIFWPGDKDALKKIAGTGPLKFTDPDANEFIVSTNFQRAAEFLASPEGKGLFDLEEPLVLTRMPR